MAATPDKSGPTRRKGSLAFPCRALHSHRRCQCCGMDGRKLGVPCVVSVNSGAGLLTGIFSPLFVHLFMFWMLGFLTAVGTLIIRRLAVAMLATPGASRLQMPQAPPCRGRSPPQLKPTTLEPTEPPEAPGQPKIRHRLTWGLIQGSDGL